LKELNRLKLTGIFIAIFLLSISNTSVSAECLEAVSDVDMGIERTHAGLVTARWSVDVNNICDTPYDGTMRVQFFIDEATVPHETVDFIILQARESRRAGGTVNLPVEDLSQINRTEVQITERERPL